MVMATAVDVDVVGSFPAANLQVMLGAIQGQAQYAADAAGSAEYKADQAQAKADTLEGQIGYAANGVGTIDYHLRIIAGLVGYAGYPASL
ncbi:hypothetical protein GOD54_23600 [Sinorhizobium medicae]|nr:hypothetical protein [Sinorhizobium medicae]